MSLHLEVSVYSTVCDMHSHHDMCILKMTCKSKIHHHHTLNTCHWHRPRAEELSTRKLQELFEDGTFVWGVISGKMFGFLGEDKIHSAAYLMGQVL